MILSLDFNKKIAFTLAEVLIVVAIIGVTAVLTIPNLSTGIEEDKVVTKLKATADMLESAYAQTMMEHPSEVDEFSYITDNSFCTHLLEHLKVGKVCGENSGCFSANAPKELEDSNLLNDAIEDKNTHFCSFILDNGVSVSVEKGRVYIDLDGPDKGENTHGKDLFVANVGLSGTLVGVDPELRQSDKYKLSYEPLAWIRQNGNMDYLKCLDSLNWNSQTTCP